MKVLLVNGSSRENGCTDRALKEVAKALNAEGIETEFFFIGSAPIADCIGCGSCRVKGKCIFDDVAVRLAEKAADFDGFVFGSPVYYAHPSARLLAVMDRAFYSGSKNFAFKPAAAIFSARRAGSVASMDVVNKHFSIASMPIVSSNYWNHVFGKQPSEVEEDGEGLMTMTNIGKNMAWLLKCIELGKKNGVSHPANDKVMTNFTR
ncbi:MAG: flavodoxin family protein [Firmicutes bacterium]|uniref:Flavodoxin family protein n=1 Tax=Candidatus Stercoripulliclostridium pullicola TaxID=2840953 RepID=A0A940DIG6_9FIRM|nr:flavodoxin family protein [Candidatus Stercoripulliclostridium pullicola]